MNLFWRGFSVQNRFFRFIRQICCVHQFLLRMSSSLLVKSEIPCFKTQFHSVLVHFTWYRPASYWVILLTASIGRFRPTCDSCVKWRMRRCRVPSGRWKAKMVQKPWENHGNMEVYPLVMTNITMENDHRNSFCFFPWKRMISHS